MVLSGGGGGDFCPGDKDTYQDVNSEFFPVAELEEEAILLIDFLKLSSFGLGRGEMLRQTLHTQCNKYNLKTKGQVFEIQKARVLNGSCCHC